MVYIIYFNNGCVYQPDHESPANVIIGSQLHGSAPQNWALQSRSRVNAYQWFSERSGNNIQRVGAILLPTIRKRDRRKASNMTEGHLKVNGELLQRERD